MNIETRILLLEKLRAPKVRRELTEEMKRDLLEISQALGIDDFDDLHIPPALLKKAGPVAKLLDIPPEMICLMVHETNVFHFNRTGEEIRTYEQHLEALRELVQTRLNQQTQCSEKRSFI
jgi:hypothetical protein